MVHLIGLSATPTACLTTSELGLSSTTHCFKWVPSYVTLVFTQIQRNSDSRLVIQLTLRWLKELLTLLHSTAAASVRVQNTFSPVPSMTSSQCLRIPGNTSLTMEADCVPKYHVLDSAECVLQSPLISICPSAADGPSYAKQKDYSCVSAKACLTTSVTLAERITVQNLPLDSKLVAGPPEVLS